MTNSFGCQCPNCGSAINLPQQQMGFGMNPMAQGGFGQGYGYGPAFGPNAYFGPANGPMGTLGGTYAASGGLASDEEIKDIVLTSLDADPRIPFDSDISIDVTGAIVTLTGTVPNKRIKHAAGDDAWWLPDVVDVNNELDVIGRRQTSSGQSRSTR